MDYEQSRERHNNVRITDKNTPGLKEIEDVSKQISNHWLIRWGTNIGIGLIIAGYLLLLGFGLGHYLLDEEEPMFGKFGLIAILLGGIVTLGLVVFERLSIYKKDPYREIQK